MHSWGGNIEYKIGIINCDESKRKTSIVIREKMRYQELAGTIHCCVGIWNDEFQGISNIADICGTVM